MRKRTVALVAASAASVGAAAIGAATATLLGTRSADRIDRSYQAMARAFFTMPSVDGSPGTEVRRRADDSGLSPVIPIGRGRLGR